jgi:hypothetical protein
MGPEYTIQIPNTVIDYTSQLLPTKAMKAIDWYNK